MTARTVQVTFDCADPGALALFWCEVLGYGIDAPPPGLDNWDAFLEDVGVPPEHRNDRSACSDPDGAGPRLFFQKVPDGKTVKNRVHLDVRSAPGLQGDERLAVIEAEAERLVALGGTRVRLLEPTAMDNAHVVVMQDPEGNEFCLD